MKPIGIFDSGIGGMALFLELQKKAPHIPLLYLADTARFPYGSKSTNVLFRYAEEISRFLIDQGAQSILIGCNASSSASLPSLAEKLSFPITGVIEPAVRHISQKKELKRVGILGTQATVRLGKHSSLLSAVRPDIITVPQACPGFAPAVERGLTKKNAISSLTKAYLSPLLQANIDSLLLACTHYSFLKLHLLPHLPRGCTIIDPAEQCIDELLHNNPSLSTNTTSQPQHKFFTTGNPSQFKQTLRKVLRYSPESIEAVPKMYFR